MITRLAMMVLILLAAGSARAAGVKESPDLYAGA
jgi:hypothetical protein